MVALLTNPSKTQQWDGYWGDDKPGSWQDMTPEQRFAHSTHFGTDWANKAKRTTPNSNDYFRGVKLATQIGQWAPPTPASQPSSQPVAQPAPRTQTQPVGQPTPLLQQQQTPQATAPVLTLAQQESLTPNSYRAIERMLADGTLNPDGTLNFDTFGGDYLYEVATGGFGLGDNSIHRSLISQANNEMVRRSEAARGRQNTSGLTVGGYINYDTAPVNDQGLAYRQQPATDPRVQSSAQTPPPANQPTSSGLLNYLINRPIPGATTQQIPGSAEPTTDGFVYIGKNQFMNPQTGQVSEIDYTGRWGTLPFGVEYTYQDLVDDHGLKRGTGAPTAPTTPGNGAGVPGGNGGAGPGTGGGTSTPGNPNAFQGMTQPGTQNYPTLNGTPPVQPMMAPPSTDYGNPESSLRSEDRQILIGEVSKRIRTWRDAGSVARPWPWVRRTKQPSSRPSPLPSLTQRRITTRRRPSTARKLPPP